MKRFAFLCGLVAAFLCLAQNASAQYAGPIHRNGAYLADARGNILSNHEVLNLIGEQVYDETYVGASKQRKTGKTLIWTGLIGTGAGVAGAYFGAKMVAENAHKDSAAIWSMTTKKRPRPEPPSWRAAMFSPPWAASCWTSAFPSPSSARSASTGWPTTTMPGKA